MKSFGCGIATLVIALAVINSASAQQYVVYNGYWQDGDAVQAPSPEQAPADMKTMSGGCGCAADYGCGNYSGCCSGWWANYCVGRHHRHFHHRCRLGCGHACRHGGFGLGGCGGCYDCGVVDSGCGCGHDSQDAIIDEKSPEQAAPTQAPEPEADKSARIYSRLRRW